MAVMISGDNSVFNALVYGAGNQSGREYMAMLNQQFMQCLTPDLYNYYSNIGNTVYAGIDQTEAMNRLRMVGGQFMNMFQPDMVAYLQTMEQMQMAGLSMQRWIMANPQVRELYQQGVINGYSESYYDWEPNRNGAQQFDYRIVTNGVWVEDASGNYSMTDWNHGGPDTEELTFEEQHCIMKTWDNVLRQMELRQKDPTSVWNNDMQY